MFGSIGIGELILIAGVALVFLGPDRFPEFAKIVARTIRDLRGYVDEAKRDIGKELKPVKDEMQKLSQIDPETYLEKLAGSDTEDSEDEDNEDDDAPVADAGFEESPGPDWYDVPDDSDSDDSKDSKDSADDKEDLGPMPQGFGVDTSLEYDSYDEDPAGGEKEQVTSSGSSGEDGNPEGDKTPSGETDELPERLDG